MIMTRTICNSSINNSYEGYDGNDTWAQVSLYQLVVFSLVSLLGITGNGLVIWFCLFRMEKTVNVIWFLNLAIADFTFALFLSLLIINVTLKGHWSFGNSMHEIILFVFFLNMTISVLQLTVISVDRCICVVFPVWCRNHRTRRLALIVVLIIWVITISSHLIIDIDTLSQNYNWIPIARFSFFFLLPFIGIVSSYTVIVWHIKDKSIIKSSKPFKIIVAMVIAFFVCWFPYYLLVLFEIFPCRNMKHDNVYVNGREISECLMVFNCCINPILYVFVGRDFKQKFCGSFQAMFEKAFTEDMGQMNFKKYVRRSSSGFVLTSTNACVI